MAATGRIGICGVDTRALTRLVRREGPPTIAIAHNAKGNFDLDALQQMAAEWPGLEGMDLAKEVSRDQLEAWSGGKWELGEGYRDGRRAICRSRMSSRSTMAPSATSSATWSRLARGLRCLPATASASTR